MEQVENFYQKMTGGICDVPQSGSHMVKNQMSYPNILNVQQHRLLFAMLA